LSVELVTAAALLAVEATAVVVMETTAFVVVSTVGTAFVVVATVDLAIATVDATESATGAPANPAPHDCAGQNAAAISTPAAIGPANDLVLTCLMAPPGHCVLSWCVVYPELARPFMRTPIYVRDAHQESTWIYRSREHGTKVPKGTETQ
jgi:hypothetical protein